MASNTPATEDPCNSAATDEETIALKKKRSRRVSFADREITSVHIFNRDEDYETPPNTSSAEKRKEISEAEKEVQEFFGNLVDGDDWKDLWPVGGADGDGAVRKSFFRPAESPSPGSSIVGSATSNDDEDNFFGPVSASFIRPGRLSDSAASDDTHDVTMDSTFFSMHYRSLARSESGGELKTATEVEFIPEEKTPSLVTTPPAPGSSMVLTKAKKPTGQHILDVDKASGGRDSNDMSLVGERLHSYDYERLSPGLEALLAEGKKGLLDVSVSESLESMSLKRLVSTIDESGSCHVHKRNDGDEEPGNVDKLGITAAAVSPARIGLDEANGIAMLNLADRVNPDCSSNRNEDPGANMSTNDHNQTMNQPNKLQNPKHMDKVHQNSTETGVVADTRLPCLGDGTPSDIYRDIRQTDLSRQPESPQPSVEDWQQQNQHSPKDGRTYGVVQNSDKSHQSPAFGSMSSLFAKQQLILSNTIKSGMLLSYVTPSPRQSGSFLSKEYIKRDGIVSSINKSGSDFKIFEPSPLASSLKDAIEKSKLKLSKFRSPASALNNAAEDSNKNVNGKLMHVPIVNLENHLSSVDLENNELERATCMGGDIIGTPRNCGSVSKTEVATGLAGNEEPTISVSPPAIPNGTVAKQITEECSPSQFTGSQKEDRYRTLIAANGMGGTLVIPSPQYAAVEVNLEDRNGVATTNASNKFVSSPVKRLDQKMSSLMDYQDSLTDLKQKLLYTEPVDIGSVLDRNSIDRSSHIHYSVVAENPVSCSGALSSIPVSKINHFEDGCQVKQIDRTESYIPKVQHVLKTSVNSLTHLREGNKVNFLSGSRNVVYSTDPAHFEAVPHMKIRSKTYPCGSASCINERWLKSPLMNELTQGPIRKDLSQCPSDKDPCIASHIKFHPLRFPNSNCNSDGNDVSALPLRNPQDGSPAPDIRVFSNRKRRIGEVVLGDADHADEIRRIRKSSSNQGGQGPDVDFTLEHSRGSGHAKELVRGGTVLRRWSDQDLVFLLAFSAVLASATFLHTKSNFAIKWKELYFSVFPITPIKAVVMHAATCYLMISLKFSADTKELLSPSIDKLNIRKIDVLQGILDHLQKAKRFQMICSQIQSQEMRDPSGKVREKRVDEARLLLCKLAYEKARLQLTSIKHEKLQKILQQLSSAIQNSQILKSTSFSNPSVPSEREVPRVEVSGEMVVAMGHEVEALEREIKSLAKSFHSYCKLKGEPCSSETIVLVNDHLKKRTSCRFIHEHLQLWVVEDLGNSIGQLNIVLSYRGLICQRFTIGACPVPSISISNELNETNIEKTFPSINACTAFAYVLNSEFAKEFVGNKNLSLATQITSSRLHNMLDVVEEVQLAQIGIRNLVQATFHSLSDERLGLHLSFINFNSFRRVMVTLDVTCLKRGVYPSELVPIELQASVAGAHKSLPEPLSAKINVAVQSLRVGYSRIIRLCKCVSQVVETRAMKPLVSETRAMLLAKAVDISLCWPAMYEGLRVIGRRHPWSWDDVLFLFIADRKKKLCIQLLDLKIEISSMDHIVCGLQLKEPFEQKNTVWIDKDGARRGTLLWARFSASTNTLRIL
ncbi:hypothetical protein Tsubulata_027031 [Turnera subulata]|uniref:Knl1 C-terminal RWD domain-containing protein n=1 Tax=Turnera subulata TaxID=218843 RepID=A0A9Q0FGL8_9ROSI|nr:hypothetical protein Tsubulata_027031 [Turnera subulata]